MANSSPPHPTVAARRKDPQLLALGRRVRALRADAGLTQEALAHAAGLHWTYVGQIERGERNPTFLNVLKLARGLGAEPARLMPADRRRRAARGPERSGDAGN